MTELQAAELLDILNDLGTLIFIGLVLFGIKVLVDMVK